MHVDYKIGIIGAGGVGGYFGAKLAQAGNDVTFVARGEHYNAIKKNGLEVKSILGDFTIKPAKVTSNITLLNNVDLIIIGVKAWQVDEVGAQLKAVISENTIVLPLQNGVLARDELLEHLPLANVLGGLCMIFSKIEVPGVIHHMGYKPEITFGEWNGMKSERVEIISKIFTEAGIENTISDDIVRDLWKKFMLICLSGLGAITNSGYGIIREQPGMRRLMRNVLMEIYQVAVQRNINLNHDTVEHAIRIIDNYPYDAMSSLARDIIDGRPSELEYQNGTVVRLGKISHIETPANDVLYSLLKTKEVKNTLKERYSIP